MSSETPRAEVNVPDEAKQVACDAYDEAISNTVGQDHQREPGLDGHEEVIALTAAAPLIVATELDRLTEELDAARSGKDDDWDRGWHAALDYAVRVVGARASELRGEG